MKLIQTITVGATAVTSIEFTSIPQTYTDLKLVLSGRTDNNGFMSITFNGSSSNFTARALQGDGSAASSYSRTDNFVGYTNNSTYTANAFSSNEIYIPNYTSSNYKSFYVDSVAENNATQAEQSMSAELWSQTAAITSIALTLLSGGVKYVQYSSASLYGILKGSGGATVS